MTSIIGVLCRDGAVVGADSAVSFGVGGYRTIEQLTDKLDIIGDEIIVAGAGSVGMNQRFRDIVTRNWEVGLFAKRRAIELVKHLSAMTIQDFKETAAPQGRYAALIAFCCKEEPNLCEFDLEYFQPELKEKRLWYESLGSAKPITDPFLALMRKVFWQKGPPLVSDAVFAVNWALEHAIEVNPGGVNGPVRIAVLERRDSEMKARLLCEEELLEHKQTVEDAYGALRKFKKSKAPEGERNVPDVPRL